MIKSPKSSDIFRCWHLPAFGPEKMLFVPMTLPCADCAQLQAVHHKATLEEPILQTLHLHLLYDYIHAH